MRPSCGRAAVTLQRAQLVAVLGPTNTGKTHLAVERMCAHVGGMIGFPLRLLAREVYDRVVAQKGAAQVALVTGEERIVPEGARYFLCTTESMVTDRAFPFLAIDEAQMAADPERGHVFTNALLHYRGTAETMILGAETLRPLLRRLLPDARIEYRPRFSTLSRVEPVKLSRLPRRSAIVAFTAEDVYALAELIRRQKGGAAVVMGSLSPRTRNAQVALYQSGEVDYLVATDAIGMGLNMDIGQVAFAALGKFDGRRHRRLQVAEMAQIAGRAGRHQRDGHFGTLLAAHGDDGPGRPAATFTDAEMEAIEAHEFPPLHGLFWRNARLEFDSLPRLIASLEAVPSSPDLWRGDDAEDLAVLRILAADPDLAARASDRPARMRLWAACGLPDYRKTGASRHARLVGRMARHLLDGNGQLPERWIRSELDVLDNVAGDIATLSDRIAAARTWTYVSHRPGWLHRQQEWAARARAVEDRLSDALHQRLAQRFVDRRTSVLLRGLGGRVADVATEVDADGTVLVGGTILGQLTGFSFRADPAARSAETRLLLAAAERRLRPERQARAAALVAAGDDEFAIELPAEGAPAICWRGARVASLRAGHGVLAPQILADRSLDSLAAEGRARVLARLNAFLHGELQRRLRPLRRLLDRKGDLSPAAAGLVVQLSETLGVLPRASVAPLLEALTAADRTLLSRAGVRFGVMHVYLPELLRPAAQPLRLLLWGLDARLRRWPEPLPPGLVSLAGRREAAPGFLAHSGFWVLDGFAVRVDMVDRLARQLHRRRQQQGAAAFRPDRQWMHELGLQPREFRILLRALGFRGHPEEGVRFHRPPRRAGEGAPPSATSPFAALQPLAGDSRRTKR